MTHNAAAPKTNLRRSNTLGRYDRPSSVAGDTPATSASILSSLTSTTDTNPTLNVCMDCKQAVESMKSSKLKKVDVAANDNGHIPFRERRRYSFQDHHRSIVT